MKSCEKKMVSSSEIPPDAIQATTTVTKSTSKNLHLADPSLAPFLDPSFSTTSFLNSILPPLLPPSTLSSKRQPPANTAVPLSTLSSTTTTLLSTLDYQTQRLLTTLTTLTDEILRISPRLGYEVDLLRSDVITLGEELERHVESDVEGDLAAAKPEGLEQLKMLAKVKERVEEVIKVFGEAMDWSLNESGEENTLEDDAEQGTLSFQSGDRLKKKRAMNPTEEVEFFLASGDLEAAQKSVDRLRLLSTVFEGTVEGPARTAVVDALQKRIKIVKERAEQINDTGNMKEKLAVAEKFVDDKKEDGGYYGLIEQLKGLRGMS